MREEYFNTKKRKKCEKKAEKGPKIKKDCVYYSEKKKIRRKYR